MKRKAAPIVENITEASAACLVTMVQGNLLALTLAHWLIASRTGVIAGVIASVAIVVVGSKRRWMVSVVLGGVTAVVDYLVHPGHFGPAALEAVVTGLGAAALSYLVGTAVHRLRGGRAEDTTAVATP